MFEARIGSILNYSDTNSRSRNNVSIFTDMRRPTTGPTGMSLVPMANDRLGLKKRRCQVGGNPLPI